MHFADKALVAETTAKMLLEVKAVLFFQDKPFIFTSGWASPVYIDCRKLIFYPRIRTQLVDFAAGHAGARRRLRAVRRGRRRRDRGNSLRGVDRRPPRPADAVHAQEAERLRPQRADRRRHARGRAHAAGRGPDHRRALEDQFCQALRDRRRAGRPVFVNFYYDIFPESKKTPVRSRTCACTTSPPGGTSCRWSRRAATSAASRSRK